MTGLPCIGKVKPLAACSSLPYRIWSDSFNPLPSLWTGERSQTPHARPSGSECDKVHVIASRLVQNVYGISAIHRGPPPCVSIFQQVSP